MATVSDAAFGVRSWALDSQSGVFGKTERRTPNAECRKWGAFVLLCIVTATILGGGLARADGPQVVRERPIVIERVRTSPHYWGWYSPLDALSARVHAQADLLRASGEASVDFATAREIRAHAVRQELRNSVERVRAYWERRRIGEEEIRKRRIDPETRRRRINGKTWERLKNHPNLSGPAIASGEALNFLMYRLSATRSAMSYSESDFDSQTLASLELTPEVLHRLRLQQNTGAGNRHVFRADEGVPLKVDWWPYVLRGDEFKWLRKDFLEARANVVADAADGPLTNDSLEKLELAFVDLSTEYRERFTRQRRIAGGIKSFQQSLAGDAFLQSLDLEIARLQSTGDASSFEGGLRFDPDRDGNDLLALLRFMARGGLEFAPSQPGEEVAYHTVFQLLRDLYLAVAEEDTGAQVPDKKKSRS